MAIKLEGEVSRGMSIKKRLACIGACLVLTGTGALATLPAQASVDPDLTICNSSASAAWIKIWRVGSSWSGTYVAPDGTCATYPGGSTLRVDVDPEWGPDDVDSYYIGVIGSGYGPCHQGENNSSDPPNAGSLPNGVRYNTNKGSC